jgi:hypothetical protein
MDYRRGHGVRMSGGFFGISAAFGRSGGVLFSFVALPTCSRHILSAALAASASRS